MIQEKSFYIGLNKLVIKKDYTPESDKYNIIQTTDLFTTPKIINSTFSTEADANNFFNSYRQSTAEVLIHELLDFHIKNQRFHKQ